LQEFVSPLGVDLGHQVLPIHRLSPTCRRARLETFTWRARDAPGAVVAAEKDARLSVRSLILYRDDQIALRRLQAAKISEKPSRLELHHHPLNDVLERSGRRCGSCREDAVRSRGTGLEASARHALAWAEAHARIEKIGTILSSARSAPAIAETAKMKRRGTWSNFALFPRTPPFPDRRYA